MIGGTEEGDGTPSKYARIMTSSGLPSHKISIKYVTINTSWVFRPHTERTMANEQPRTAQATDVRNEPKRAVGSIPPSRLVSADNGKRHTINPSTGMSRTASL